MFDRPLEGLIVLDFSQFLSAPSATLRLSDMGARVIKVERPVHGDICRTLYVSNMELDGDSTLFHSINRNKESFAVDLHNPQHVAMIHALIKKADVLVENFRPGVMQRLGLDYESVRAINPQIVYGEITGYGTEGPWKEKPGQDLLVQACSGLLWLNRGVDHEPVPFGLSITDMIAGAHLVQGILACLVRRSISGVGAHVEVSLLESVLDTQVQQLTSYLNGGHHPEPVAAEGLYATADGYIAIGLSELSPLCELLGLHEAAARYEKSAANESVLLEEARQLIRERLKEQPTAHWLDILQAAQYPCADVLNWQQLLQLDSFGLLDMIQNIYRRNGASMRTTCCPIRIDGQRLTSPKASPKIGEDNEAIIKEMGLNAGNANPTWKAQNAAAM